RRRPTYDHTALIPCVLISLSFLTLSLLFFFFNDTATTEIYTLSLHDALPILIIPMLCVTIFVILVVWFLLPRVARLMIHTTNIKIGRAVQQECRDRSRMPSSA